MRRTHDAARRQACELLVVPGQVGRRPCRHHGRWPRGRFQNKYIIILEVVGRWCYTYPRGTTERRMPWFFTTVSRGDGSNRAPCSVGRYRHERRNQPSSAPWSCRRCCGSCCGCWCRWCVSQGPRCSSKRAGGADGAGASRHDPRCSLAADTARRCAGHHAAHRHTVAPARPFGRQ